MSRLVQIMLLALVLTGGAAAAPSPISSDEFHDGPTLPFCPPFCP
jgi:hypothetical protein